LGAVEPSVKAAVRQRICSLCANNLGV